MKIERIQRIRNYRIFRDFIWPQSGLPDFGRFNLIYGWNRSGKTTLSELFRHLQMKEPIVEGDVQFVFNGNIIHGNSLATVTLPPIRVFNRDTVDRMVFENPDQEFPPIFILGEESGEKQRQFEQLQQDAAKAAADQRDWENKKSRAELACESSCENRAREIKNLLIASGGGPYNNYNKSDFKKMAEELSTITPPVQMLTVEDREKYLTTKSGVPKERVEPLSVQLPDLAWITQHVKQTLDRSVQSRVLEELVADPAVAAWVSQGLPLHTGDRASDKCKFCDQHLPQDRLNQLQAHFNDEFKRFQGDIDALMMAVISAKNRIATIQLPARALLYPHLANEYDEQVRMLKGQSEIVGYYLDALNSALEAKKREPFTALSLPPFLTSANPPAEPPGTLEKIFQAVIYGLASLGAIMGKVAYKRINELICEHNKLTDNFSKEIENARRALEIDEVLKTLPDYRATKKAIEGAENKLHGARKIQQAIEDNMAGLKRAIRNHQKSADDLNKEMAAYLGRDELQFEVRDTGYIIRRNGRPAMHLCESERTAVAFMYFLKSLSDADFDLNTGIVVVDDPVSSLDANSLYSAFGYMKSRTENAGQLFVLTHNFTFFRQVKNWFNYIERLNGRRPDPAKLKHVRFYMLKAPVENDERNARIILLDDLLHKYESEYYYLFRVVYDAAKRQQADALSEYCGLPNIGRRLLETVLAFKQPERSGELYRQLLDVKGFDEAKKTRIIRFVQTYSHSGQISEPEHDLSILAETPEILRDILSLIEHVDPAHFNGMVKSITPPPVSEH